MYTPIAGESTPTQAHPNGNGTEMPMSAPTPTNATLTPASAAPAAGAAMGASVEDAKPSPVGTPKGANGTQGPGSQNPLPTTSDSQGPAEITPLGTNTTPGLSGDADEITKIKQSFYEDAKQFSKDGGGDQFF